MVSYQCREVRVYIYCKVYPVPYVREELFSDCSLVASVPLFLPFLYGFIFEFFIQGGLGNPVEDDWSVVVAGCVLG